MLHQLASAIRARQVSAVEVTERAFERIGAHNAELNAVVALRDAGDALAEAEVVDVQLRLGRELGPLAGIPFLVKDNHDLSGLRTTQGSMLFGGTAPAKRDSLTVARLRAAGAIPIGKTNVPEFCLEGYTANKLFGATHNPWALKWSPGGSSGGSGAALAAGMVPIATATDGAGSVRIPAAFCGLFGLKPTNGLIARDPIPSWIDYTTDGPLGLSIADVRLLLEVQSGPCPGDPSAMPHPFRGSAAVRAEGSGHGPLRPSVVYAAPRLTDGPPLPEPVMALFTAALTSLEKDLGFTVMTLHAGEVFREGDLDEDWGLTALAEHAHEIGQDVIEKNAELLTPRALEVMRAGLEVSLHEYLAARRRRFGYVLELDRLLGDDRVIVSPTLCEEGFLADGRMPGADEPGTPDSAYNTSAQNVTGHPALSVPAGVAPNGVPFGLQITGPRFADDLVLRVGEAWAVAHPGPGTAPGYASFWER